MVNLNLKINHTKSTILTTAQAMSGTKRKHSGDSPSEVYNFKSSRSRPTVEARVDPTYGQRSALPGLDDSSRNNGDNNELDNSEDMDALSYLRAVR